MTPAAIQQLNRKLGDALGYVCGGTQPRFCWRYAPELPYWRSRLGPVWVLCQWQKPGFSPQQWNAEFGDRYPYPINGMYHAHSETAQPPGQLPTEGVTQNYIWALDQQMSTSFVQQYCDVLNEVAEDTERADVEWVEQVQDSNPAFSNFESGKRGGHVSYGGLG